MTTQKVNAGSTAPTQDEISRRNDILDAARRKAENESGKAAQDKEKVKELLGRIHDIKDENNINT